MNPQEYKRRLLDLERRLSDRTTRAPEDARVQAMESPGDAADASVAEEAESEELAEAQLDGPDALSVLYTVSNIVSANPARSSIH